MKNKLFVLGFLCICFFALLPKQGLAVCAQMSDKIILFYNNKQITTSDYILISQQKDGQYKLNSFCLEGICLSDYFYGDGEGIYFLKITSKDLNDKIGKALIKAEIEAKKNNPQLASEYPEYYINYELFFGKADKTLLQEITDNLDKFEKIPFFSPNKVPNKFDYSDCAYSRIIKYDLYNKKLTSSDSLDSNSLDFNIKFFLWPTIIVLVIILIIKIFSRKKG